MNIRFIITISILSMLVLLTQACSVSLPSQPTTTPQPTQTSFPTSTATPAPTLHPGFGELLREEAGGFTYIVPDGFKSSAGLGIVSMLAEGADPEIGPSISLIGGPSTPDTTAQSLLDILKDSPGTSLSEPTPIEIGGFSGLSAEITILNNDFEIVGRIVALVTPENQFLALAGGPEPRWKAELETIFETILTSVTFFTPIDPDAVPDDVDG